MESNKKVILINGTNSNWYEQVIFILKPSKTKRIPENLVAEAEKIINEYMIQKYSNNNIRNVNKFNKIEKNQSIFNKKILNNILNLSIFCCVILIGFLLYKIGF